MTAEAMTYVARRDHPTFGTLIKIGHSRNPDKRCSDLGARRIRPLLPTWSESYLHDALAPWRAYVRQPPYGFFSELDRPIFTAPSEWYRATPQALAIVDSHIDATAGA